MPDWIVAITVSTAPAEVAERADRRGDRLRDAVEAQLHLGDDPERALRADEEPRQVVAGRRLARPAAGRTTRPSAVTTVSPSTFSRIVP